MSKLSLKSIFMIALALTGLSLFFVNQAMSIGQGFAQSAKEISLVLVNSSFAPLTTVPGNRVRLSVMYQVNDESFEEKKINGIMRIYSSNGTLIHSSSFPDGFVAKKKGGTEVFRTTITDPAIKNLMANVTFIALERKNILSNTVTANLSFQESGTPTTAGSTEEEEQDVIVTTGPELQEESTPGVPLPIPTEQEGQQQDGDDGEDGED
jgi:hypothetical protein